MVQLYDGTRGLASVWIAGFCDEHLKQRRKDGWKMRKSFQARKEANFAQCRDCPKKPVAQ
jgi:hypothetical protein